MIHFFLAAEHVSLVGGLMVVSILSHEQTTTTLAGSRSHNAKA